MTEDDHGGGSRPGVTGREGAAQLRARGENLEVAGGHLLAGQADGLAIAAEIGGDRLLRRERGKYSGEALPVEKVRGAGGVDDARPRSFPHARDAIRRGEWKGLEQNRVHHTEHPHVGSYAERQNAHHQGRESGRAAHRRYPVGKISQQRFNPRQATVFAVLFLHLFDSSEAQTRGTAGILRREAARQGVSLGQFQVGQNLAFQFGIEAPLAEHRHQALHSPARRHDEACRKRATRAVAFSHLATSTWSCLRPVSVRE